MNKNELIFTLKELPVDQVEEDDDQPRRDFGIDGDQNRLLVSIKRHGILNPITVSEVEKDRFIIIDGHRRYRCAKNLGFEIVSCRVYPRLDPLEFETLRFEMQNNLRRWRPLERSNALARLKSTNNFKSNRELAEYLGLSETIVANLLQLRELNFDYIDLMNKYELTEAYQVEFIRLKPKIRKIRNFEISEIIENLFERVKNKVIKSAKGFRKLGRIFLRATANEEELHQFLSDKDMTIDELEQRTLQSGFSLHIEQLIQQVSSRLQKGTKFDDQEKAFLERLRTLLNEAI